MNLENGKNEKMQRLAEEILILSRNKLLVNLRYLDMALSMFTYVPMEDSTLMVDGKYFLYNPQYILKSFRLNKDICVRDYLHAVMHCVYRHMFAGPATDRILWDTACDIAVENVINELGLGLPETGRQRAQNEFIGVLREKLDFITAEKVYSLLKEGKTDTAKLAEIRGCFYADNHDIWYMSSSEKEEKFGIGGSESSSDNDENGDNNGTYNLSGEWQKISERMQVDAETFSKSHGNIPGSMVQNLKEVNREKYDYTAFLKKFAVLGEVMKINDDEFDYIFYTYGLKLYDKMPLVEPLEYKDVKRIREFVIAIDTSGSVSGELVQKFVQKTYNILESTESFFSKINLHIIQCDAEIQEHIKITNKKEFDEYIKNMRILGLGGTDFRPVFSAVEKLIDEKEFTNLKGLLYFTDGCGTFPSKKPDYETAFVFIDDNYNNYDVPAWAIKLVLKSEEI